MWAGTRPALQSLFSLVLLKYLFKLPQGTHLYNTQLSIHSGI